eukprot:TRINITY_DN6467_c0_g1_i9.p1 TRINITY_DN6467_c0_g1~~TRINITY_DN6467_c0_g1_i9.p1  ORF type:complete len:912 (-),score=276.93 TRINITY_DN6467_c0_g1_i9:92-2827(-)
MESMDDDFIDNESPEDKKFWKELYNQLYWLQAKKLVPGYDGNDPDDINILAEVIAACKDGSNWKDTKEIMLDYKEKFFDSQRRVVDENFGKMEHTLECTETVIEDYRYMANCVKILKQNVRNVLSQTKFNSHDIFQTFFSVEKLGEEVRLLKVIERVSHAPEKYKLLVDGKHFVHAVHSLSSTINELETEELKPVQALTAMNGEMKGNIVQLETIIVDALKEHLYLDSEACWDAQENQRGMNRITGQLNTAGVKSNQHDFDHILNGVFFETDFDTMEPLNTDPENESFRFMALCIEALSSLGADVNNPGNGGKDPGGKLAEAVRRIHSSIQYDLHQVVTNLLDDFEASSGQESESLIMSSVPIDGERSVQDSIGVLLSGYVSASDEAQMNRLLTQISVIFERIMLNFSFFIVALNRKADQLDALYPHMPETIPIFPLGTDKEDKRSGTCTAVWSAMQNILVTFMDSYLQAPQGGGLNMSKLTSLELEEVDFEFKFEDLHLETNDFDELAFSKRKFQIMDCLPASPFYMKLVYAHQSQFVRKMQQEISEHCFFMKGKTSHENPWKPERGTCPVNDFLTAFILNSYFPFVDTQVAEYLDSKLSSTEAFKRVSKRNRFGVAWYDTENQKGALIDAVAQTQLVLEFLFEGVSSVEEDTFLEEYMGIVERVVDKQLKSAVNDFIHHDFSGIVYGSTTEDRLGKFQDPTEVDPGTYAYMLYHDDPYLQEFKDTRKQYEETMENPLNTDGELHDVSQVEIKEAPFDAEFLARIGPKGHDPGGKPMQLMGINAISQLTAISTSMNWLALQLLQFKHKDDFDANAQLVWDSKATDIADRLDTLVAVCHGVADKCLVYLRTELRNTVIVTCQVVKPTRRTFAEEQAEIDPNISALIKELSKRLTPASVSYTHLTLPTKRIV